MDTCATPPSLPTACADTALARLARRRVQRKLGFYQHLLVFVLVNAGLAASHWAFGRPASLGAVFYGWGIGLAVHGLVTLVALHGENLRERMLAQELARLQARG